MLTADVLHRFLQEQGGHHPAEAQYDTKLHTLHCLAHAEQSVEKSVLYFSKQHYNILFAENGWVAAQTIYKQKSIIQDFVEWYRFQPEGMAIADPSITDSITIASLSGKDLCASSAIESTYFASPSALHRCLTTLYGPDDGLPEQRHLMDKLYYALLWEGLPRSQIPFIPTSSVKRDGSVLGGAGIPVYSLQSGFAQQYSAAARQSQGYQDTRGYRRSYAGTGLLLRSTQKKLTLGQPVRDATLMRISATQQQLAKALPVSNEYYGRTLNARTLRINGAFWRLLCALQGDEPTLDNPHLLGSYSAYKGRPSGTDGPTTGLWCYMADYQHWRSVFHTNHQHTHKEV